MPPDPERALQGAIYARLRAQAALVPFLGSPPRVYDAAPADPVHPFLTFGRCESRPWGGSGDGAGVREGAEIALTLTCVSRFGGSEEAKAVAGVLRTVLHDAALTLDGHRLVSLRVTYTDTFRAADSRLTLGLVRLRAVVEPL